MKEGRDEIMVLTGRLPGEGVPGRTNTENYSFGKKKEGAPLISDASISQPTRSDKLGKLGGFFGRGREIQSYRERTPHNLQESSGGGQSMKVRGDSVFQERGGDCCKQNLDLTESTRMGKKTQKPRSRGTTRKEWF